MNGEDLGRLIASRIIDVPDFPQAGVVFKDLSPLFADGAAFRTAVDAVVDHHGPRAFDIVAGIEARGFVIAAAVAYASGAGLVALRKAGKLPRDTFSETYELEYGSASLELHTDAFPSGTTVLLVDDVLATGGTAAAAMALLERAGAEVIGLSVLIELAFLDGRLRLPDRAVHALHTT